VRRCSRLTVLNRVLRHNLRNDLTVVRGHAELLAAALDDPDLRAHAETVIDETDGLVSLGEKARTFEGLVGEDRDRESVSLHTVVDDVVAETRRNHPDATVTLDATDAVVETDPDLVRLAVAELVENGVVHGGETPRVEVGLSTDDDGAVVVTVVDDGPGIPDHEVAALGATGETDLEHASGIGLWLVQWSAATVGGDVTFDVSDGTTARLRVPDRGAGPFTGSA
jgi:signal transduction histidine kinase